MTTSVYPRWEGDATPPFVENLAVALVESGWEVCVLAPGSPGAPKRELKSGVEVKRFVYAFPRSLQKLCYDGGILINLRERPWTHLLLPFFYLAQIYALWREARRFQPAMIHSHSLLPQGLSASWVAHRLGISHITTSHGNDVFGLKATGLMGRWKRKVLQQANAITVNSTATRQAVIDLGANPDKVHLIPAMPNVGEVDPEKVAQFTSLWKGRRRLLFVGRLIDEKGVGDLIEALALLRQTQPEVGLVIVGEGTDRFDFEEQVRNNGLEEHVHFTGWMPKESIPSIMAAAEVLVVPSKESKSGWKEAQGLVVVEAMAVGTLVVASRLGGLVDMIRNGETGFLTTDRDPSSLRASIESAMTSDGMSVTKAAEESYHRLFAPEAVTRKTDAIYLRFTGMHSFNESTGLNMDALPQRGKDRP